MSLRVVAGSASGVLTDAIAARLGVQPASSVIERFPDSELRPAVDDVCGDDVYVIQATGPPVNDHVVELLLLLDATRRAHAGRVTAVIPYLGYARQDRRDHPGDAVAARVVADAIATAGAHRAVLVDPHTTALEAMFSIPVETLTAVPVLADALGPLAADDAVVVAPDLGGVKLAEAYAQILDRPVAVVRKTRLSGTAVHATQLVGDVTGRPAIIVDDMISTGATIEAAAQLLLEYDAVPDITVATTHGLLVGDAAGRLGLLPLRKLLVTDSITPPSPALGAPIRPRRSCPGGCALSPPCSPTRSPGFMGPAPSRMPRPRSPPGVATRASPGGSIVSECPGGKLDDAPGGHRLRPRPLDGPEFEGDEHRPLEAPDVLKS